MDWSLVLVSQGIETAIEQSADGGGWALVTSRADHGAALRTLRQYGLENRGWPWRQTLPWTRAHFDWGSVAWIALLIFFHWFASVRPGLRDQGVMDSTAMLSGQWWRVFTAMMLHGDVAHLAANMGLGLVLLGLTMGRFGTGTGLLAAYLAGAVGNVASLVLNTKPFYGLGASGMVMGALGVLSAQSLARGENDRGRVKDMLVGLAAGVMLFALYGLAPGTDLPAHFGGFVAGLGLGAMLANIPAKFSHSNTANLVSGMLLVTVVVTTWWLAAR
ncbi:MAG: rhomboid-related rane protein [Pedosphaera sp.]|nr:rhomboid-related rane protein [Pedosphaera sp.]